MPPTYAGLRYLQVCLQRRGGETLSMGGCAGYILGDKEKPG